MGHNNLSSYWGISTIKSKHKLSWAVSIRAKISVHHDIRIQQPQQIMKMEALIGYCWRGSFDPQCEYFMNNEEKWNIYSHWQTGGPYGQIFISRYLEPGISVSLPGCTLTKSRGSITISIIFGFHHLTRVLIGAKSPCHSKVPVKADSDSHQQSASLLTNNVFLLSGLVCTILPVDR